MWPNWSQKPWILLTRYKTELQLNQIETIKMLEMLVMNRWTGVYPECSVGRSKSAENQNPVGKGIFPRDSVEASKHWFPSCLMLEVLIVNQYLNHSTSSEWTKRTRKPEYHWKISNNYCCRLGRNHQDFHKRAYLCVVAVSNPAAAPNP